MDLSWPDHRNASRKYVDLINQAESKWAVWDPENVESIKPGDYGKIDHATGAFLHKGSIYKNKRLEKYSKDFPPVMGSEDDHYVVASGVKDKVGKNNDVGLGGAGAEVKLKGDWAFQKTGGAILLMFKTELWSVPKDLPVDDLFVDSSMTEMFLVTDVWSTNAFVRYLAMTENDSISLKLVANAPKLPVPGAVASAHEGLQWDADRSQGSFKSACHEKGDCVYTTLYTLKHLRPKHHLWPFSGTKVTYASHGVAGAPSQGTPPVQQRQPTLVHELEDVRNPWEGLEDKEEESHSSSHPSRPPLHGIHVSEGSTERVPRG